VKRRSTSLISSSLIFFVTLLASDILLPCHLPFAVASLGAGGER
jgi:hypothetical protein